MRVTGHVATAVEQNTITFIFMIIVWGASGLAGLAFIWRALKDRAADQESGLRRAANEVRFRLRLAAGIGLVLWVISGILWVLSH